MNSYELSRKFFDWCFENPNKIHTNHIALYFFCIEHCNRLGWKSKFGLPTTMAKEAIGIRSYNTYKKTLDELVEFGFITMLEYSKNQYSANIIALSNYDNATDKALDKAFVKHLTKQSKSKGESNSSIDKQLTLEQLNSKQELFSFEEFWNLYPQKVGKKKCEPKFNNLPEADKLKIKETLPNFISYKPFKDYIHPNPETYLNQARWDDGIPTLGLATVKTKEQENQEKLDWYRQQGF